MPYQIDQSIKIEDTRRTTYACIANSKVCRCAIPAKEKRLLELYFKKLNKPLIFKLFTFSVLCAKMIFQIKAKYVIIDTEYPGHNREIKSFINQIIAMYNHLSCTIYFERIGKKSRAHLQGYKAYKTNQREIAVSSEEVLRLYNKVNKGQ